MYTIIKKDRERQTEMLRLTTESLCSVLNDFSVDIACVVSRLPFTIVRLDMVTAVYCKHQLSNQTIRDWGTQLLPICDKISRSVSF